MARDWRLVQWRDYVMFVGFDFSIWTFCFTTSWPFSPHSALGPHSINTTLKHSSHSSHKPLLSSAANLHPKLFLTSALSTPCSNADEVSMMGNRAKNHHQTQQVSIHSCSPPYNNTLNLLHLAHLTPQSLCLPLS